MDQNSQLPTDFLREIPKDLPVPQDDWACNHLLGTSLPSLNLSSTSGQTVNLAQVNDWVVIYCYPMTGKPGQTLPLGWIQIPGAAGCTPQSCSFRDHYQELQTLKTKVFGISTQTKEDQKEAVERLHLPFELLSDASLKFAHSIRLPTFEIENLHLIKRVTIIAYKGQIVKYFYPIFPPDKNVQEVIAWLQENAL